MPTIEEQVRADFLANAEHAVRMARRKFERLERAAQLAFDKANAAKDELSQAEYELHIVQISQRTR